MGDSYKNYKLIYFNGRGRGEGIRYLFKTGDIKFEDKRVELGGEEWKKIKPDMPFGQIPVLEVDGHVIAESVSIARFVAKVAGLAGDSLHEQGVVDSVVDKATEFREGVATTFFMEGTDDEKAKALENFLANKASVMLDQLTKMLAGNDYFVGKKLSFADIWFYACLELLIQTGNKPDYLKSHPKLKALYERVGQTPKIAEYLKSRAVTPF